MKLNSFRLGCHGESLDCMVQVKYGFLLYFSFGMLCYTSLLLLVWLNEYTHTQSFKSKTRNLSHRFISRFSSWTVFYAIWVWGYVLLSAPVLQIIQLNWQVMWCQFYKYLVESPAIYWDMFHSTSFFLHLYMWLFPPFITIITFILW